MGWATDILLDRPAARRVAENIPEPTTEEASLPWPSRLASIPFDVFGGLLNAIDYGDAATRALAGRIYELFASRPPSSFGTGRQTIFGPAPSGRELLGQGPGEKGKFEGADVPGTAVELALSPINLLSFGTLTAAGKAAKAAKALSTTLRVAEATPGKEDIAKAALEGLARLGLTGTAAREAATAVPRGLAEQAAQGLRRGLALDIPGLPTVPLSLFGGRVSGKALAGLDVARAGLGRALEPLAARLRPSGRLGPAAWEAAGIDVGKLGKTIGMDPTAAINEGIDLGRGTLAEGNWLAGRTGGEIGKTLGTLVERRPEIGQDALAAMRSATDPMRAAILARFEPEIAEAVAAGETGKAAGLTRLKERHLAQLAIPEAATPADAAARAVLLGVEKGGAVEKVTAEIGRLTAAAQGRAGKRIAKAQAAEAKLRQGFSGLAPLTGAEVGLPLPGSTAVSAGLESQVADLWRKVDGQAAADAKKLGGRVLSLSTQKGGYEAIRDELPPALRQVTDQIAAAMGTSYAGEQAAGVRYGALQDALLGYMKRTMPQERFEKWAAQLPEGDLFAQIYKDFKTTAGFTIERSPKLAGLSIPTINDLAKAHGFEGQLFSENPAEAVTRRLLEGSKATARASVANGALQIFAVPAEVAGPGARPIAEVIRELKLGRVGAVSVKGGELEQIAAVLKDTALEGMYIPKPVAEALTRFHRVVNDPEAMQGFLRVIEKANGIYRLLATQFSPGFHARNYTSDLFMGSLVGFHDPRYLWRAGGLQTRIKNRFLAETGEALSSGAKSATDAELATMRNAVRDAAIGQHVVGETAKLWKRAAGEQPGALTRGFSRVADVATRIGTASQDNVRIAMYLWGLDRGMTSVEAGRLVKKALFDYSDLSWPEKMPGGLRSMAYFYTYVRKAIPYLMEELVGHPRRLRAYAMLTGDIGSRRQGRENMPAWLAARSAFGLGRDAQGQEQYLSLGLPPEILGQFSTEGQGPGRGLSKVLAMMAPLPLKMPIEVATGTEWQTGRREPRRDPLIAGMLNYAPAEVKRQLGFLETLAPQLPGSRLSGSMGQLLEAAGLGEKDRLGLDTLASLALGATLTRVNREKAGLRSRLDRIEGALKNFEQMDAGDTDRAKALRSLRGRLRRDLSVLNR